MLKKPVEGEISVPLSIKVNTNFLLSFIFVTKNGQLQPLRPMSPNQTGIPHSATAQPNMSSSHLAVCLSHSPSPSESRAGRRSPLFVPPQLRVARPKHRNSASRRRAHLLFRSTTSEHDEPAVDWRAEAMAKDEQIRKMQQTILILEREIEEWKQTGTFFFPLPLPP